MDMFINIRHNYAFQENSKTVFVNKFCVLELQAMKFLTQKEPMITQILAASPSPNFNSRKSYFKRRTMFTFQQFVTTFLKKLKSFSKICKCGYFRDRILLSGQPLLSYREIVAKRVTPISFLSLISLKTVILQSVTTHIDRDG